MRAGRPAFLLFAAACLFGTYPRSVAAWETAVGGIGGASVLGLDATGAILTGGTARPGFGFSVAKIGRGGILHWLRAVPSSDDGELNIHEVTSIAVDPASDVVMAGSMISSSQFTVVKLSGTAVWNAGGTSDRVAGHSPRSSSTAGT
jgi:hypothetical protein